VRSETHNHFQRAATAHSDMRLLRIALEMRLSHIALDMRSLYIALGMRLLRMAPIRNTWSSVNGRPVRNPIYKFSQPCMVLRNPLTVTSIREEKSICVEFHVYKPDLGASRRDDGFRCAAGINRELSLLGLRKRQVRIDDIPIPISIRRARSPQRLTHGIVSMNVCSVQIGKGT